MSSTDDISLAFAKAKMNGYLPDVSPYEADMLRRYARDIFRKDSIFGASARVGNRTIILGDSIAAGADQQNTYYGGSWFSKLCTESSGLLRPVRNAGIGGNTSAAMLARIYTDVVAYSPDICILEAITPNDISNSLTYAQSKANIIAMLDILQTEGIRPIVCTGPPSDTTANRDRMNLLTGWLISYANSLGISILDIYTPMADPADGTYLAAYTSDGTHPNASGIRAVVNYLKSRLPSWLSVYPVLTGGKNDVSNLIANGVFVGDTNADGIADNWVMAGTATTKSLAAGEQGNWQQFDTGGALGYLDQNVTTGFSPGDTVQFAGRFALPAAGPQVGAKLAFYASGTNVGNIQALGGSTWTEITSGSTFYAEAVVPAGTTMIDIQLVSNVVAGTVKFGQVTLRNLSTQ